MLHLSSQDERPSNQGRRHIRGNITSVRWYISSIYSKKPLFLVKRTPQNGEKGHSHPIRRQNSRLRTGKIFWKYFWHFRLVVLLPMVEFDTSTFHVSLSNTFKRNLRLPWLRIHHQNWLYEYNSWFGKFGILCTTDQANVFIFFFNYFSPKVCPPILGYFHYSLYMTLIFALSLALDQALRGASSNYVSGISMLLSFQISANQRECKQTLKNTCQG